MSKGSTPETLDYTPDEDIKVHEEGAIRLLCRAFQSHENGIPEWAKNAADEYARLDRPEEGRAIVLICNQGRRGVQPSISCVDFGGMTSQDIEQYFRVWADPDAAGRGGRLSDLEGGHGNGGKCYMSQMFERYAVLKTVKRGKGCVYGVPAGSVRFGYIPDPETGRDFAVADTAACLAEFLAALGVTLDLLRAVIDRPLSQADGFTIVTGVGPKGYAERFPVPQLVDALVSHLQMMRTLQLCKVYVVVDGELFNAGRPLQLADITPLAGAEEPRVVAIPETLADPVTHQHVSTTLDGRLASGCLTLRTSDVSMRWARKFRHNVTFRASSGFIGYVPMTDLDVQSTYRDRIYGECHLEGLEGLKQNDRTRLAESPLSRATLDWISEQVQDYCGEFEARDRRWHDQEERTALSRMNEALDRWKNEFLNKVMRSLWGSGEGPTPSPPPPLPSGTPVRIDLELTAKRAGLGVSFRPRLRFFDREGRQIRAVPYRWVSEDTNVAMVDEDLNVLNTFWYGETKIYAETMDRRVQSDVVDLEVVRIHDIRIEPREVDLVVGGRTGLEAVCRLSTGEERADILLVWTENDPSIARVSSAGVVFGFSPGETYVTAGDNHCMSPEPGLIRVRPSDGAGSGDRRGRGYPLIRLSEIEPDPETGEQVVFSRGDAPIWQRPVDVDRNIWWINTAAPLASMYLDQARGYGYDSREWRIYHLDRYVDIVVQIALTHGPEEREEISVGDWILRWGEQAADIQEAAASSLAAFISDGTLPGERGT